MPMTTNLFLRSVALAASLVLPVAATAQQAVASKWVNLRAGPARDYPLVMQVSPGTPLAVQGCVNGFTWCDVIAPNAARGWVYGGNLDYPYQSSNVPLLTYGAAIGIPIVTFVLGNYWGNYYRDRPWYRDRPRWEHHRPPSFRPPRPPPRPPVVRPPPPNRPPGVTLPNRPGPPHGARPPGDHRPPGGMRPPGGRPGEGARPPGGGNRPGEGGRPSGGGRPPGGGESRPQPR